MAVEEAQVAVPPQRDYIDNQNSVMQRYELEVDDLDEGPDHPVGLKGVLVRAIELILRARTLHDRHAAEEEK